MMITIGIGALSTEPKGLEKKTGRRGNQRENENHDS